MPLLQGSQRTVPIPQVRSACRRRSRDPFVVVAAAEIDAEMVVAAPAGIDEAMVFNPDRRDRQAAGAPVLLTPLIPVPGGRPGQVPGNAIPPRSPMPATPPLNPLQSVPCRTLDDVIEWNFRTLVDGWILFGLPVLLVMAASAVTLIVARSRPGDKSFAGKSGARRALDRADPLRPGHSGHDLPGTRAFDHAHHGNPRVAHQPGRRIDHARW